MSAPASIPESVRPPTSLREANVEARRRRILEAARALIVDGGLDALSMRKLAKASGVSVTTLYNLYGSRGEILTAMIDAAVDEMIAILDAESTLADPIERAFAVIEVTAREFGRDASSYRPMLVASYASNSLSADADRRIADRAVALQNEALSAARTQGMIRADANPLRLAEQVYHGYELACAQWAFGAMSLEAFEARALYGLVLVLLAVADDSTRPGLESRREALEARLAILHGTNDRARTRRTT